MTVTVVNLNLNPQALLAFGFPGSLYDSSQLRNCITFVFFLIGCFHFVPLIPTNKPSSNNVLSVNLSKNKWTKADLDSASQSYSFKHDKEMSADPLSWLLD